jgi:hypothetical protein
MIVYDLPTRYESVFGLGHDGTGFVVVDEMGTKNPGQDDFRFYRPDPDGVRGIEVLGRRANTVMPWMISHGMDPAPHYGECYSVIFQIPGGGFQFYHRVNGSAVREPVLKLPQVLVEVTAGTVKSTSRAVAIERYRASQRGYYPSIMDRLFDTDSRRVAVVDGLDNGKFVRPETMVLFVGWSQYESLANLKSDEVWVWDRGRSARVFKLPGTEAVWPRFSADGLTLGVILKGKRNGARLAVIDLE